jgi:hypothetical protein
VYPVLTNAPLSGVARSAWPPEGVPVVSAVQLRPPWVTLAAKCSASITTWLLVGKKSPTRACSALADSSLGSTGPQPAVAARATKAADNTEVERARRRAMNGPFWLDWSDEATRSAAAADGIPNVPSERAE